MTPIPPSPPVAGTLPELPIPVALKQAQIASLLGKLRIGQQYDRESGDARDMSSTMEDAVECIEELLSAISAHEAEVGRLRKALEPFAKISTDGPGEIIPNGYASPALWRTDVCRARAALTQGETK